MKARNVIGIVVLCILGAVLGWRLYSRGMGRLGAQASAVATPFRTEEQWMVGEIARDLEEMARYAKTRQPVTAPSSGLPTSMPFPAHGPWFPADYEAHAKSLLQAEGVAAAAESPSTDTALLTALTDPSAETLAVENRRVSDVLQKEFTSPRRHEEAALLLGAFALREAEGHFADVRPALNRMTAHLALAAALGGAERGLEGRYADIVHAVLAGRTVAALDLLGRLPEPGVPAEGAWRAALHLRATQNWRAFGDPSGRTPLEQFEYLRALVATESGTEALAFFQTADIEHVADWCRLAAAEPVGVELGNMTVLPGLPALVTEIGVVRLAAQLPPVADGALPAALAAPPGRCIGPAGPQVLDWGAWAAFYSRAIVAHVALADRHLRRVLYVPDRADAYQARMDRDWGALTLYPIASTHRTRRMEMNLDRIADAIAVAIASPQLLTAHNWGRLAEAQRYEPVRRGMPVTAAWFQPAIPRGTAFDARHRLERLGTVSPRKRPDLESLAAIDPHDFTIATNLARARFGARPTLDQMQPLLGARAAFDSRAEEVLSEAAPGADPKGREPMLVASCERKVEACFDLGYFQADAGREEEAAATIERALNDPKLDRVLASHYSWWLIDYHFRHGDRKRAEDLAREAASTGSQSGLLSHAALMEMLDRYGPAERSYQQMAERYNDRARLTAFHYRMARVRKRAEYEPRLKASLGLLFPRGLERVETGTAPPTDGAYVNEHNATLLKAGLRAGDVIVGLDGWRIRQAEQYAAVNRFTESDEMTFTIWRGGYQEVKATVKNRWLGVTLVDYPLKGWVAGKPAVGV